MKKLVYLLMFGLAFTTVQVAPVEAQRERGAPSEEEMRMELEIRSLVSECDAGNRSACTDAAEMRSSRDRRR